MQARCGRFAVTLPPNIAFRRKSAFHLHGERDYVLRQGYRTLQAWLHIAKSNPLF